MLSSYIETTNMGFPPLLNTPGPTQHRMLTCQGDCGTQPRGYTALDLIPPAQLPDTYPGQKMANHTLRKQTRPLILNSCYFLFCI